MDTWAELRRHVEALEVDASLHPAAADENSDGDASPKGWDVRLGGIRCFLGAEVSSGHVMFASLFSTFY